ncbi:MAG: FAD-binding oxidoreductase [Gluconacetobacter diazotrophicus]|nr:FAD-binding oxidoreductase [Gluconacetobacter diazotrophicus]
MIPRLRRNQTPFAATRAFLAELAARGFEGELSATDADRVVFGTDNSIYQVEPDAVAFPRGVDDLRRIALLGGDPRFAGVAIRPRGGGTGTNGQSLGAGVVVDVSRHMNRILRIDAAAGVVRVEAGVVKDQLNRALAPHGLFFAPELSTSNRATIGGMVSTDACGQGSCLYGKTRHHVLALRSVLADGTDWESRPLDDAALAAVQARPDLAGEIHRVVDAVEKENRALIAERFPRLNRSLTGYDLAHIRNGQGSFDLNAVLCGSEGTLCLLAEAELRVLPIPRHTVLAVVGYAGFDAALRDARMLGGFAPAAVETVDGRVLALARADAVWGAVAEFIPGGEAVAGVNLVEFVGDDPDAVEGALARFRDGVGAGAAGRLGVAVARGGAVAKLWEMRKRAVGLLGAMPGEARPVPFVEDAAVPPERLADFVAGFRAVLDRHGLQYGMFGHVDAGVLHVRPALDLKRPEHRAAVRPITEAVVALAAEHGGLLWGEHGKGMRSEFVPAVFGPLFPCLQAIKRAFDAGNRFNPGKIAVPDGSALLRIDAVPMRGERDREIPPAVFGDWNEALHCNGNGACFNFAPDEAMCPSWKQTRERRHSPKGRASLMREWLRLLAEAGVDPRTEAARLRARAWWRGWIERRRAARQEGGAGGEADFSHAVHEAMDGCLACKSCTGSCPIKVDVPGFRARFLELYHGRYRRPLRHHVVALLEPGLAAAALVPALSRAVGGSAPMRAALERIGLVDVPAVSRRTAHGMRRATARRLAALPPARRERAVVMVPDAFTAFLDAGVLADSAALLRRLGFEPLLAPFRPNGKPLHVHGFLGRFERVARRNAATLRKLACDGIPLVGIEPSTTLAYRDEYRKALGEGAVPAVSTLGEFLGTRLDALPAGSAREGDEAPVLLLPHCTERTNAPGSVTGWAAAMRRLGMTPRVAATGCCGMAGTYGHEREHREASRQLFDMSWAGLLRGDAGMPVAATGYSCRSQAKRFGERQPVHPARVLIEHLDRTRAGSPAQ